MISYFFSFIAFSILASITPGPTNILSFSLGMQTGLRRTLPFVFSSSASASLILFFTFFGISHILLKYPLLQTCMTFAGALWLSWMAVRLFKSDGNFKHHTQDLPNWKDGAFLQIINPKVWMMALTVSSLFLFPALDKETNAALLAFTFFIITCPCMGVWAVMGAITRTTVTTPRYRSAINKTLSILLLLTVWGLIFQTI